ncbi:MAG: inositol 2-dehydrogenase [Betaproteobacteria bacterium AqS2]|uniref:Inositol 2-dehydrogenase n=1 Tax=Candidatus Amphirhobacter heronislandensis TaxID=1732024 RepID=A0A930UFV7_9GAMM|nr:inositol 2-dehydrogenase [Betaproteobacteria bacterium AqS2]
MIRFALLGCGRIGVMHAGILARLAETGLARVYDIDEAAAAAVAKRHGAAAAASPAAAVEAADVDAVLVASATPTHADFIEIAVRAGKPVLCEKPIDLDVGRVRACQEVVDAHPEVPVQIGFNRRFDPGHAAAFAALAAGEIGELLHAVITSRDPGMPPRAYYEAAGGLLRDMTIHDFDLARCCLGEEPAEVFAVAGRLCDPALMAEIDDHDSAMVILRTAGGKLCHINNTRAAVYGYDQRIELHGDRGMVISDNNRGHNLAKYTKDATASRAPLQHFFIDRYLRSYELEILAFVAAVKEKRPPSPGFADGLRALLLAEAAYRSVKSGKIEQIEA